MARLIGGTVAGYLVYFVLLFALMSVAWFLLGANGAFQPGTWDVTGTWIAIMLIASLLSGVAACRLGAGLAKHGWAPMALAGLVIVMGLLFAWPVLTGVIPAPPLPRPEPLPMLDAMSQGQAPIWVALANPLFGAVGVLLGTRSLPKA